MLVEVHANREQRAMVRKVLTGPFRSLRISGTAFEIWMSWTVTP